LYHCGARSLTHNEKLFSAKVVDKWEKKHGGHHKRKLASFSATIPVYFHAIQYDANLGNLSTTDRDNMMTALNTAYTGSGFSFVHMGTDSIIDPAHYYCQVTLYKDNNVPITKTLHKGGSDALNVYVCDTTTNGTYANETTLVTGWSSYPEQVWFNLTQDGVFVVNPAGKFLNNPSISYQAIPHEAGHWLGLMHTFEESCTVTPYSSYQYLLTGDGVADTPSHFGPTQNLNGSGVCWIFNPPLDTCPDNITGIDPGPDPVKNRM
jgi:hypothetical protein